MSAPRLALVSLLVPILVAEPPGRNTVDRLGDLHLEAVHEARLKWSRDRVVHPPVGIYNDYRAVMHVHAEDADHTKGTREQVLEAAKQTGVKVVLWTDHRGPKPDSWSGFRGGVLFIPGSEDDDHKLRYPLPGGDLLFLSHVEELAPDSKANGFTGMEIYNRHADAIAHPEMSEYIEKSISDPKRFSKLAEKQKKYPDEVFGAATGPLKGYLERWDRELSLHRPFTGIAANDAHRNVILKGIVFDPYEVSFRNVSTHILARESRPDQIVQSLREGRVYVAHDWLCDPSGFAFVASNNLGVYEMGDHVPMIPGTKINVRFPVKAKARLILDGTVVHETTGLDFSYTPSKPGVYRLEADLTADGEPRPWIYANPMFLEPLPADALRLPPSTLDSSVSAIRDLTYAEGSPEDASKHKLDLYLPKGKQGFPVIVFVHGGSWRSGDRSLYPSVGNRLAKAGFGVAIPSYRLAPKNRPPAQIEDVAAAFAWVRRNIAPYGGDPDRIVLVGHSAGGHLVSELALDPKWLVRHELSPTSIRGVATLSGVYDVGFSELFGPDPASRRKFSPLEFIRRNAPPFLITYCQWDYPGLGPQARQFSAALRRDFVETELVYIPGESHISEMVNFWKDDDKSSKAVIDFAQRVTR